jgi:hypothetical protein
MRLLGHRDIRNTLIYIDVEHAIFQTGENDEFTTKVADNVEAACKLAACMHKSQNDPSEETHCHTTVKSP